MAGKRLSIWDYAGQQQTPYQSEGGLLNILAETELGQNLLNVATDPVGQAKKAVSTVANKVREANRKNKEAFDSGNNDLIASRALDYSQDALGFAPIGMTVWHGSPHKFDKFDMSKIGTGEGAQAYGHGLYMAEAPDVADNYAKALSAKNGQPVDKLSGDLAQLVTEKGGIEQAKKFVNERLISPYLEYANESYPKKKIQEYTDWLNRLDSMSNTNGQLYKVDIPDEAVARFLDWDKPLSQQPEVTKLLKLKQDGDSVEAIVDAASGGRMLWDLGNYGSIDDALNSITGQKLNQLLRKTSTAGESARVLNDAGIPGIRYLDGGSRSAGQGSSNFVLFSDDLPRILEINGQATGNQPWAKGEWGGLLDTPVSKEGPRAEAMRIAQANAAKPVSEGGLGLRPDNTPMERAKALGFDTPAYHGTNKDFPEFDMNIGGMNNASGGGSREGALGVWSSDNPEVASTFASWADRNLGGGNVMPLLLKTESPKMVEKYSEVKDIIDKHTQFVRPDMGIRMMQDKVNAPAARQELLDSGFDSVKLMNTLTDSPDGATKINQYLSLDPTRIRSRFAAFDPARRHESDLLGFADPRLLALIAAGTGGGLLATKE